VLEIKISINVINCTLLWLTATPHLVKVKVKLSIYMEWRQIGVEDSSIHSEFRQHILVSGQRDALVTLSRGKSSGTHRRLGRPKNQLGHLGEEKYFLPLLGILTSIRPTCKVTISVNIFIVISITVTNWNGIVSNETGRSLNDRSLIPDTVSPLSHASVAIRTSGSRGYSYSRGSEDYCWNFTADVTMRSTTAWSEFAGAKIIESVN